MTSMEKRANGHLWVIGLIAASAAVVVTATWAGIGNVAGFPPLPLGHHKIPTGLALATGTEGYTGYAVWAWLAGAAGDRSRKFAGVTAIGALTLSLAVQAPYHLMIANNWKHAPAALVIGASSIVVIDVILGTTLAHLMHADAADAQAEAEALAQAERRAATERAENDERAALRAQLRDARNAHAAELEAARAELDAALRQAHDAAQAEASSAARASDAVDRHVEADREAAELRARVSALEETVDAAAAARSEAEKRAETAEAKAERLSRKLGPNSGAGRNRNAGAKDEAKNRTTVPNDVDARAQALMILAADPGITGKELGERCGRGERWGQLRKSELAGHVADGTGAGPGSEDSRD